MSVMHPSRVGYGAVERFGPADGDLWSNYIACSGMPPHLTEVVTLDGSLCPNLVTALTDEDWQHNVHEDGMIFFFRDLDYFLSRFDAPDNYQVLAVIPNPQGQEALDDPRFAFIGYDLLEGDLTGGTSALTNCGGFEKAFAPSDLSEYGLVSDYDKAVQVNRLLREYYPDEPHAFCDMYALWRMTDNHRATEDAAAV